MHSLLDRLTEMHKVGALDTACDMLMLLHGARAALTDNMVERLFVFFEQMINTVGNEAMGELAENTRLAFDEAADEMKKAPPRGGLMAMLSMLSKPESAAEPRLPARLRREAAEAGRRGVSAVIPDCRHART